MSSHSHGTQLARIHGSRWLPYMLVLPGVVYLLVFQGIPLLQEMRLSVSNTSLLNPSRFNFIGVANFSRLLRDPNFFNSIQVTAIYVAGCVIGTIGLGLFAALLMDREFTGRSFVRSLIIIPWAAPPVAIALVFRWMLNGQYGIVNRGLEPLGLMPAEGLWLDNPSLALITVLAITIWQLFPFTAVVILASLQSVPKELKEAAQIDGAGLWAQFHAVTWPVIRPTVALLALLMTIWSIRRFELIWLLTQGGPVGSTNTLVIDLYRRGFIINKLGEAAAVGMVGMAVSVLVTIAYFAVANRATRAEKMR
ncbi:carbohydrate ABC transporter permease [Nitratireductor indicus]|nr:sugar ABC transporter permease [Nitratireductor indicus]MDS1138095.1 sugar ABC transporter permease [Nitratireductor indicus]SFQ57820.1 multiple sugar transport system permease protein [Nitratireductor indicus]